MKKGFTLIELLAVLIILAVILAITTPNVLHLINSSKDSTELASAKAYLKVVEQSILNKNLESGEEFEPNECIVEKDGNLTCDGVFLEIDATGEKPSNGNIIFKNGKITGGILTFKDKILSMNSNGEFVESQRICKLIDGETNTIGSKYQCKVKDNMEEGFEEGYYFFVLGTNSDGTTNLIMERNMYYDSTNDVGKVETSTNKGLVAWYASTGDHSFGPVTAMTYLHNATKDWDNIPNMIMDYEDENINYDTHQKGTNGYGSCPLWLSNYLNSSSYVTGEGLENISGIYGYWTLSTDAGTSSDAWRVNYNGIVGGSNVDIDDSDGVRPVITLKL